MASLNTITPGARLPGERGVVPTALGLALGPAAALGLARFAYALLLPAMKHALHWSYAQAGAMNTANAVGYLLGALVATPIVVRLGSQRAFLGGLLVTALALLGSAAGSGFVALLVLRAAAGLAGAVAFIAGAGLAARLSAARAPLAIGIYSTGGGLGISASGAVVPPLLSSGGAGAWRLGWLLLGLLALVATLGAARAARRVEEPATEPVGHEARWSARRLAPALIAYGLFGTGYIAYMTFIIAFLRAEGLPTGAAAIFWVVLGLAAAASAFVWGPLLGRLRGGHGEAVAMATVTLGTLVPLASSAPGVAFISALLFGGSFLAVVAAVTALVRRTLPAAAWTPAIAALTVAFAIGQCLGPLLAGALADSPGGVRAGLLLAAGLLALGAIVALAQSEQSTRDEESA